LRAEGIEVIEPVLEEVAVELNKRFFTFHQKRRPYLILKWAQSKEGYIGSRSERILLSDSITHQLVHQWRAEEDAVWVGYNTARIDNPQLNVRYAEGKNPVRIVYDRRLDLDEQSYLFDQTQSTLLFNTLLNVKGENRELIKVDDEKAIPQMLGALCDRGILSVLVEGGQGLIQQLIDLNLWDEARMIQTVTSLPNGVPAPVLKNHREIVQCDSGTDRIHLYKNTTLP
jgi:diaminohydroxyphosphoribosylaminopyrimidine deaminase/5-amino-6-(5-phosphoribosylamino)uracil reductase